MKSQIMHRVSLRAKLKADCVELCIIDANTGAIQYERIPFNFEVSKSSNAKVEKKTQPKEEPGSGLEMDVTPNPDSEDNKEGGNE